MVTSKARKNYISVPITHLLKPAKIRAGTGIEQLNNQLVEIYERISLSKREIEVRKEVFNRYKSLIEKETSCRIESFGSFRTTLAVRDSDIDITVLAQTSQLYHNSSESGNNVYNDSKSVSNMLLNRITRLLEASGMVLGAVIHIKNARTPILKLTDEKSNCKIDVSINKLDGIQTAEYILNVLTERPYIRYPALILKYFLKKRRLGDTSTGGLCSYAQFLLLLNFFQMHPLVQNNNINIKENLGVLMIDFFQFYGIDFPYNRTRISVTETSYSESDHHGLYISDPVIPGNNVASGCSMIGFIRDVFKYSYRIMTAALEKKDATQKCLVDLWVRQESGGSKNAKPKRKTAKQNPQN